MHQLCHRLIAVVWLLLGLGPLAAAEPLPTLVLIQNSGWMEPFYTDPRSTFRQTMKALVAGAAPDGGPIIVASFNQNGQVPGRPSPEERFRGPFDPAAVAAAIDGIDLPKKPNGAFTDSDFAEALRSGIALLPGDRGGILFLVTNNQNAPGNTPDWAARTRAFFRLLETSDGIARVYAMPVRGAASGEVFGRREGYIVYALAYGNQAAEALDARIGSEALTRLFGGPAVRLKPLDRETVRFEVTASSCPLIPGPWIKVAVRGGRAQDCVLEGRLRNRLYPQTIESARVAVELRTEPTQPGLEAARILIDPATVSNVPAGGLSQPVTVTLKVPALLRDGLFDRETRASGVLSIALADIRYGWDQAFLQRLSAVPLGDEIGATAAGSLVDRQLPEIFLDATRRTESRSDLPLQVVASHSRWPLYLLIALALAALAGFMAWRQQQARAKPPEFVVDLGGESRKIAIRKGDRLVLVNSRGARFEVIGQGGRPPLVRPSAG